MLSHQQTAVRPSKWFLSTPKEKYASPSATATLTTLTDDTHAIEDLLTGKPLALHFDTTEYLPKVLYNCKPHKHIERRKREEEWVLNKQSIGCKYQVQQT